MATKGNFRTYRDAKRHAAKLRREFPRMKPIRIVKRDIGWDVITSR